MRPDLVELLHLFAHEIRSPTGVLQGYLRMLHEGRLTSDVDRVRAYENMRTALGRISALGQETARLAHWLEPGDAARVPVNAGELVARGLAAAGVDPPLDVEVDASVAAAEVAVLDRDALEQALGTMVRAVARESGASPAAARVAVRGNPAAVEIILGPLALLPALEQARQPAPGLFPVTRGGLGLSVVTAVTVLAAHAAEVWTIAGERSTAGIRLPVAAEEHS